MSIGIAHCLWFDNNAEEAAKFYASIFKGKVGKKAFYTEAGTEIHGGKPGTLMSIEWEVLGQKYIGINGGPVFKHSEAFSITVLCDTQEEIDHYWRALLEGGGEESQCGWLKDRFGVSWQVTPRILGEMMADSDRKKVARVTDAFMKMVKFDVAALRRAFEGKS
jgi:predicted 3-demethylubiquinone-9 3-methyltransferase (glyoxalase superfamily)